jgi:hypothetical protein
MAIHDLPYKALRPLLRARLSTEESPTTLKLMSDLRVVRKRGYFTTSELERIARWKSPRVIGHIRRNSAGSIRRASADALATRSEKARLESLTTLTGVSVPMASAVLTLLDPRRYGVIDIRVWQLLHELGTVTKNPQGTGFAFNNWYQYLKIIRYFAGEFGVKARDIERTLFCIHKEYQDGPLYGPRTTKRAK